MSLAEQFLTERAGSCSTNRLPTNRFPQYVTTIGAGNLTTASDVELTFQAQRDTLFAQLSVVLIDDTSGNVWAGSAKVSVEYCNVDILDGVDSATLGPCCDRRPQFLLGLRENKILRVRLYGFAGTPPATTITALVTLAGIQGQGCCN